MIKSTGIKLVSLLSFMLISVNSYAAFLDYPVPPEYDFSGTINVVDNTGFEIGPAAINFYPASLADFEFSYLGATGTGYDSSIYTLPGTYDFISTADSVFPSVPLSMTVNDGQIGLRTFIDWNLNTYDILTVWDVTQSGNSIFLTATDMDGDGIRGYNMVSGPFAGYNVMIDAVIVTPIPAAFWLFGSGLLALAGMARRRV